MPSKNQKQSEYLESLKANIPENQQQYQPNTSERLDDQFFASKEDKKSNKKENKDSIDSRVDKFSKFTGSKPFMYGSLGASFVKPIGRMASKLSATTPVSEHLLGSVGGYYQGGIKSISSAKNVGRSLQRQKYQDQLGTAGKVDQGYRALTNAARLSYSANMLSGLSGLLTGQGGAITPGSSFMGKLTGPLGGMGTAALMGTGIASSMMTAGKMRKIMALKKTPEQITRKTSKATNLDPYYRILRNDDQLQPNDQLQYMLLSYIEEHTSVLPSIYSDLDYLKQQKDKASKQVDHKINKITGNEEESILNKVENAINTVVTKYDPISQLSTFIFGGGNPKKVLEDIQKGKGLYGKELEETKQQANLIGVTTNQYRLLDLSSQNIAASGQSYESKMFALTSALYDVNRFIAQETATMRKHGFGVEHNNFNRPISKKGLFAKLEDAITSIPVISAGYNIIKDLILLPTKATDFFKGMFSKGADFIFGKDFLRFQKQEELDKELGFLKSSQEKSTEFIAEGLPNLLEKVRTIQAQQLDIQYNIFDVLKDSYNLAYTQATGEASGRGYKQFVSADSMSERIWDAVESKMLTAEGMEQALQKRQDLRQLEREKTFKKGVLGKFAAINEITPGGKREVYEQMEKYLDPINKLNENFNNLLGLKNKFNPFILDQDQKDWERSTDIRRSIRRDDYVRGVGIEGEREKQKADWQTGAIGATNLIFGGSLAAITGGMSVPITAAITTAAQAIFNQIDENEEFNKILEGQGGFRRVITSVEDELNKRSDIVDRNFSSETNIPNRTISNNQLSIVLEDSKNIQTQQLKTQRNIFELLSNSFNYVKENINKIVEKISLFSEKPSIITNNNLLIGLEQIPVDIIDITNFLNGRNYREVDNLQPQLMQAANGGNLNSFTIVGERGPELIIGNRVYNKDQVNKEFGMNILDLINKSNIRKLADGGEIPTSGSKASDYSVFFNIKNTLIRLTDKVSEFFNKFKNNQEFAASQQNQLNKSNIISLADKLREDREQKKARQEQSFQNNMVEVQKQISDNTKETNKVIKKGFFTRKKESFLDLFKPFMTGMIPYLASGAALASVFFTGGLSPSKLISGDGFGTTAAMGFVGKLSSKIFQVLGNMFEKSPEFFKNLLSTPFKKAGNIINNSAPVKFIQKLGTSLITTILPKGIAEKFAGKFAGKTATKVLSKAIGKAIPGLGVLFGGYYAIKRLTNGDPLGALVELGSGIASIFPGLGTAVSIGADVWLALRDKAKKEENARITDNDPGSRTAAKSNSMYDSIKHMFGSVITKIRHALAKSVSGIWLVGKRLANLIAPDLKFDEKEDDKLIDDISDSVISNKFSKVKDMAGNAYNKTKNVVTGTAKKVGGAIGSTYNYVKDAATSLNPFSSTPDQKQQQLDSPINKQSNFIELQKSDLEKKNNTLNEIISSQSVINRLKQHIIASEGIAYKKYTDNLGNPTIGVGHLIQSNNFPNKLNEAQVKELFNQDLNKHAIDATNIPGFANLSDVRKAALIDMVFNMGINNVKGFENALYYLNQSDYQNAAKSILESKYAKQVGERAARVSNLIQTGDISHFNKSRPKIIARYGAFTGNGTQSIEAVLHPNEIVFGKGQFQNFLKDIIENITEVAKTKIKTDLDSPKLVNYVKQYDKLLLDEKLKNNQNQQYNKKSDQSSNEKSAPVIIDNSSSPNIVTPTQTENNISNSFTKIDDSLDQIVYNLFNMTTKSLNNSLNDFVFNNNFSFDF